MTQREQERFDELEKTVQSLLRVENNAFIKFLKRRVFADLTIGDLPSIKLSDLEDVEDTDSAVTGRVLKKTSTTWQPAADNIA